MVYLVEVLEQSPRFQFDRWLVSRDLAGHLLLVEFFPNSESFGSTIPNKDHSLIGVVMFLRIAIPQSIG